MSEWRKIETAPKDGTLILGIWTDKKNQVITPMKWRPSRITKMLWGWHVDSWFDVPLELSIDPTHWMPVPSPPDPRGQIEERALARDEGEAGNAEASLTHSNEANK